MASNSVAGGGGAGDSAGYPGSSASEGSGGAIFNQGTLTVDRTTLCGNTATGGPGGRGGHGIYGSSTLNGSAGSDGGGASGAAICNWGSLWLTRSTLVSNVVTGGARGAGGYGSQMPNGEYGYDGARGGNGSSGLGGALFNRGAASLVNCTIAFDTGSGGAGGGGAAGYHRGGSGGAGGNGGSGFGAVDGTCNLTHCTVAWNRENAGPGGTGGAGGLAAPPLLPGAPDANGSSGTATGGTACGPMPNTLIAANTPAGGDSFTDPKLGPLANNGGPTLTMALLPGSPAIDAGNPSLAPATDQRGVPRLFSLAPDIGAFEFWPTLRASPTGSGGIDILASGISGQTCRLLASSNFLAGVKRCL